MVIAKPLEQIYEDPEMATMERLRRDRFTPRMIESFFRPFLGGVFLERALATSSRKFEFVFRMFSQGEAALPAEGMEAIPRQIAAHLPPGSIRTDCAVESVTPAGVTLASGESIPAQAIVVATDVVTAARLLGDPPPAPANRATCLYFAAEKSPLAEPILVLNGEGHGPINNLCVPTQVNDGYGADRQALISVVVIDDHGNGDELTAAVRGQLAEWYGHQVDRWRYLKTYHIPDALPQQPSLTRPRSFVRPNGLYVCGDYLDFASIQGAMATGRQAAEQFLTGRDRSAASARR
jgi:hypothetical protein